MDFMILKNQLLIKCNFFRYSIFKNDFMSVTEKKNLVLNINLYDIVFYCPLDKECFVPETLWICV